MNTTTAALEAHVTVATVRTWCRAGVVAAVKQAGRWIIDTASLARRVAIGAMRARKQATVTQPTGTLVLIHHGLYGVRGNAADLAAAFEAGTLVTLDNADYAGDKVRLGHTRETRGDYGRTLETLSLSHTKDDGQAVYYIDMNASRMDEAPAFKAALLKVWEEEEAAEDAANAADDAYFNPRYM